MRTRRNPAARHLKQFQGADDVWFDDLQRAEFSLRHAHHCGRSFGAHTYSHGYLICPTPTERESS